MNKKRNFFCKKFLFFKGKLIESYLFSTIPFKDPAATKFLIIFFILLKIKSIICPYYKAFL